jgi:hypothetical protein
VDRVMHNESGGRAASQHGDNKNSENDSFHCALMVWVAHVTTTPCR